MPLGRAGKACRLVSSAPCSTAASWPRAFTSQLGLDSLQPPFCPLCHLQLSTQALSTGTPNGSTCSPCLGQDQNPAGAQSPLGLGMAARTSGLFSSMLWPRMPLCTFGTVLASHYISSLYPPPTPQVALPCPEGAQHSLHHHRAPVRAGQTVSWGRWGEGRKTVKVRPPTPQVAKLMGTCPRLGPGAGKARSLGQRLTSLVSLGK